MHVLSFYNRTSRLLNYTLLVTLPGTPYLYTAFGREG